MAINGRTDMLIEWLERIEAKLDRVIESHAEYSATVRAHGAAIKWLYGIVGAVTTAGVIYGVIR